MQLNSLFIIVVFCIFILVLNSSSSFFSREDRSSNRISYNGNKYRLKYQTCERDSPFEESPKLLVQNPVRPPERETAKNLKVHFMSYGNENFRKSKRRIRKEAWKFWKFASIRVFEPKDLDRTSRDYFRNVLNLKRGGGYWLWKILLIRKTFDKMNYGEYVLYLDAGSTIVLSTKSRKKFLNYLLVLQRSSSGVMIKVSGFPEIKWTTSRIFEVFDVSDKHDFLTSGQLDASMILLRKQKSVVRVLDELIRILHRDMWIITDKYNRLDRETKSLFVRNVESALANGTEEGREDYSFIENRHDQSLLSLAFKCSGFVGLNEPHHLTMPFNISRIRD